MSHIYVSVVIDAPPADVWAVVEPIERHVDWMADADAIRFEGLQRRGVGTRIAVDTRFGPLRLTDRMYVTEWIDGAVIGVDHVGRVWAAAASPSNPPSTGARCSRGKRSCGSRGSSGAGSVKCWAPPWC